jgi:phospholipid/cholesterol/gamma-HCH transport system permease protein
MRDDSRPPRLARDDRDPGTLRLEGNWTLAHAMAIGDVLRSAPATPQRVDATAVDRLDSAGVLQLLRYARRNQLDFESLGLREEHRPRVPPHDDLADHPPPRQRQ